MLVVILAACGGGVAANTLTDGGAPGQDKQPICHVPPGNPSAAHIIYPDDASYDAHLPGSPGGHDTDFFVDKKHPCPPGEETTTTKKPHETTTTKAEYPTTTKPPHETTTTTKPPHETTTTKPPHETTTTKPSGGGTTTTRVTTTTAPPSGGTTTTSGPPSGTTTTTSPPSGGTTTTSTTAPPGGPTTTVEQVFFRGASVVCQREVPTIVITFGNLTEFAGHVGILTMSDLNGVVVSTQELTYIPNATVQLLYPGTQVNPDGSIADVPGWNLNAAGFWVEDPSDAFLRDGILLTYTVNPTATAVVTYPPASSGCNTPPGPTPPVTPPGTPGVPPPTPRPPGNNLPPTL